LARGDLLASTILRTNRKIAVEDNSD
jgi:hypothetical protein